MVEHGIRGSILNLGSACNKVAFPRLVDYTASKGGIEQFTKVSATELGPHGVRVNCVAPGAIEHERTKLKAPGYAEAIRLDCFIVPQGGTPRNDSVFSSGDWY